MRDVAVLGLGMHPWGKFADKSVTQLCRAAVEAALADAGLAWRDVQDTMRELWDYHERGKLEGAAALWFEPRPEESLYDTWSDPHEVHDLATAPDYEPILERLRARRAASVQGKKKTEEEKK